MHTLIVGPEKNEFPDPSRLISVFSDGNLTKRGLKKSK